MEEEVVEEEEEEGEEGLEGEQNQALLEKYEAQALDYPSRFHLLLLAIQHPLSHSLLLAQLLWRP